MFLVSTDKVTLEKQAAHKKPGPYSITYPPPPPFVIPTPIPVGHRNCHLDLFFFAIQSGWFWWGFCACCGNAIYYGAKAFIIPKVPHISMCDADHSVFVAISP